MLGLSCPAVSLTWTIASQTPATMASVWMELMGMCVGAEQALEGDTMNWTLTSVCSAPVEMVPAAAMHLGALCLCPFWLGKLVV
ncbi:unnamed protein product [Caretta caretta]